MGTIISGSVIPLSFLAQSRYALQAIKIDSVPPLVVVPAPPSSSTTEEVGEGWLKRERRIETIDESI
jgi:hypothetical protein